MRFYTYHNNLHALILKYVYLNRTWKTLFTLFAANFPRKFLPKIFTKNTTIEVELWRKKTTKHTHK